MRLRGRFTVWFALAAVVPIAAAAIGTRELVSTSYRDAYAHRRMAAENLARQELELGSGLFSGDRHGADLMAAHFEQVLVAGLLAAQPNSSHLAPEGPTPAGSRTVRLAMDLIAAEPERPWRVAELAREVGVSARTLQDAFQREHGISPLEQVRRVRLDRARTDLLNADPSTTSVTTVASRWGYFHLGRFGDRWVIVNAMWQPKPQPAVTD